MDYYTIVGMVVVGLILIIGAFISVGTAVSKVSKMFNDLKVAIETLNATISNMNNELKRQDERLKKHGDTLDDIMERLVELETKMMIFHGKGGEKA